MTRRHWRTDDHRVEFDRLLDLFRALEAEGAEYVLVGGVAMGLHGLVRATQDVDLFVRPEAGNVARDPDDARLALMTSNVPIATRLRDVYALWRTRWPFVHLRGVQRFASMDEAQACLDALRRSLPEAAPEA